MISVIIPTYNERDNIKHIVPSIIEKLERLEIDGEVIVIDDSSPDKTWQEVKKLEKKYKNKVFLVKRKNKSGLSSAITEGIKKARGEIIGVMDADFSHPPECIPDMLKALEDSELVIGSRYVKGGSVSEWPFIRKIISKSAILLSRPLTNIKDPVSGFFFFKKNILTNTINPIGYKLCLELIVKGNHRNRIKEVPYTFSNRKKGKSKLNIKEIANYLIQLTKLYKYKIARCLIKN